MNTLLTQDAVTPPDNSTREIPLTQGKVAIVDAADYEFLSQWKWHANKDRSGNLFYAARTVKRSGKNYKVLMHRLLLNVSPEIAVDHKDRDGLNNRRSNLRLANKSQNRINARLDSRNKCGLRGASWCTETRKWRAQITVNKNKKYLGSFDSPEDAHAAYMEAAREHFGEFAETGGRRD